MSKNKRGSATPCEKNKELKAKVEEFAEVLKVRAHELGGHGLDENEFYNSGLFRGAVEQIRGEFVASMRSKREFVSHVLNHMVDEGRIKEWISAGSSNRHDYSVTLNDDRVAAIELKGCLDGNNTNIFSRPPHADEFIIWSVCTNASADPNKNVWSGIHTRLSAEMIDRDQRIDGLIVWDYVCGTLGRPCPKLAETPERLLELGPYKLPPPCIYMFPSTVPSPRNNPNPQPQKLASVDILSAFNDCFGGWAEELYSVFFSARYEGSDLQRKTEIRRDDVVTRQSGFTSIKRD
jgi:hypothetical protein